MAALSLEVFETQQKEVWQEYEELLQQAKKNLASNKKLRDMYPIIAGHYAFLIKNYSDSPQSRKLKEYLHNSWRLLDIPVEMSKPNLMRRFLSLYFERIPQQIYRNKKIFFLSLLLFWLSILTSFLVTINVPEFGSAFLGSARYHHYQSQVEVGIKFQNFFVPESSGPVIFMQVFLNNFKVSLLSFLGGILLGVGTLYILMKNAFLVGGLSGIYYRSDHFIDFMSVIFQHGFLELMAISISGAAGFLIAAPWFFSGHIQKKDLFRKKTKQAMLLFLGSTTLLLIAGLIEGLITPLHLSIPARFTVIFSTIIFFGMYVFYSLRRPRIV